MKTTMWSQRTRAWTVWGAIHCLTVAGLAAGCESSGKPWPPGSGRSETESTDSEVTDATDTGDTDSASTEETDSEFTDTATDGAELPSDDAGTGDAGGPVGVPEPPPGPFELSFDALSLPASIDQVTDFVFLREGNEMLATSLDGTLHHLVLDGDGVEWLSSYDLPDVFYQRDCGLISLALDPDFDDNGYVYVGYCVDVQGSGVFRMTYDPDDRTATVDSLKEVIVVSATPRADPADERPWHNVGSLTFDESGALWVPFGDKLRGSVAQDPRNALGSLLRIIPNREPDGSGYDVPEDNPFADGQEGFDAVYSWGLRSPWRGLIDGRGRFWVGDVGATDYDEIDVVDGPGVNMGWPVHEGPCSEDCERYVNPITGWDRELDHPYMLDDPDVNPLQARVPYVAIAYEPLKDRYRGHLNQRVLFGDYCTGYVRAGQIDDSLELTYDEHVGHIDNPAAWRQGPDGYIYVMTYGRCQTDVQNFTDSKTEIFRVVLD